MLGLRLLAFQLLLILVQEEGALRSHRGQRLEDVRHGTEAVLRGELRVLRQEPLLGADGAELEVFSIHGDVGCQRLQVQLIEIHLQRHRAKTKQLSSWRCPPHGSSSAFHHSLPLPESFIPGAARRGTRLLCGPPEGNSDSSPRLPMRFIPCSAHDTCLQLPLRHPSTDHTGVTTCPDPKCSPLSTPPA